MAGVRDPLFWRRFSIAIHQDEEQNRSPDREKIAAESWLARQKKKRRRSKIIGCLIAFAFLIVAGGVAFVIWWLNKNDWFRRGTNTISPP
ncbi:hypothetical protein VTN77DRAFT_6848 [Rasamsonia byssochlamydoides]|uniref:uncharacterized protein n=1 Tax=Rasamsonia byssochlamydoides TaxID=89139 RepID=UPI0037443C1F